MGLGLAALRLHRGLAVARDIVFGVDGLLSKGLDIPSLYVGSLLYQTLASLMESIVHATTLLDANRACRLCQG